MRKRNYEGWSVKHLVEALRFQVNQPVSKYPGVDKRRKLIIDVIKKELSEHVRSKDC